jgi:aldose 1-epimerase
VAGVADGGERDPGGRERPSVLDPSAPTLTAGDLRAVFLPRLGMLGASLRHDDEELLGRVDDLASFALTGAVCGVPLLHPWANRLAGPRYRAAGRDVALDPASPLLYLDEHGLPMHGVPWSRLSWRVTGHDESALDARLDWAAGDLLAVFPFPHRLDLAVRLRPGGLTVETALVAGPEGPVPVAFGFHPYLSLAGLPRAEWRVRLPAMRRLLLDGRKIPTGETAPAPPLDASLGGLDLDDGFAVLEQPAAFTLAGRGRRLSVELLEGYPYAQVYAPRGGDYLAFEPMTAPANALVSGRGLRLLAPGERFRATFRIGVEALPRAG